MSQPTAESTRLLKARDCRDLGTKVAFNFEDVRKRCEAEIAAARRQSQEILQNAQQEAEQIRRTTLEESRRAGFEQGSREADAEIQRRAAELAEQRVEEQLRTALPAIKQVGDSLDRERDRWLAEWEAGVIQLCVAIAEKLVRRTIEVDPQVSLDMIREALQLVTGSSQLQIRLNPKDKQQLADFSGSVAGVLSGMDNVSFIADETVSPGGCLLENEQGTVDARLETQLRRIFEELTGNRESSV